ncbi:baseplate wedge subunit [Escherichia phage EcS1]|uniref:Baseplate wedge subunit n=1 Tax=Escherichia phage EcS1 TaxID=2083276 RepID=A0A2Z5ZCK8_9CAUD|nr:baseplate wedge subunit [Escherichia phage EcS1]BBC78217.1 Baseplate wedge subunit [Escherichia phage EcS1]
MIFSFFDPVSYQAKTVDVNAPVVKLTDIYRDYQTYFNRVIAKFKLKTYYISGAPRPEELANILYGNTQLYWVLLMCNANFDPFHGWITSQEAAYQSAIQRYQDVGGEQVLYHIDALGELWYNLVEDPANPGNWYDKGDKLMRYRQYQGPLAAVDTYEDAIRKNEHAREIKIIDPNDIESFLSGLIREMEKA